MDPGLPGAILSATRRRRPSGLNTMHPEHVAAALPQEAGEGHGVEVRAGRFEGLDALLVRADWVWERMLRDPAFEIRRARLSTVPSFDPVGANL